MKKIFICLVSVFLAFNLSANEKYEKNKYFCTSDRLKLRESAGLDSKVITVLEELTAVEFLQEGAAQIIEERLPSSETAEYHDNWVKIKTVPTQNSKTVSGWVYGAYLEPLAEYDAFSDSKSKCLYCRISKATNRTAGKTDDTFYFLENEQIIYKTLTVTVSQFDGPNWSYECFLFPRIENNKKHLYVATKESNDGWYNKKIERYDMTDYKNSAWKQNDLKFSGSIKKDYMTDNSKDNFHTYNNLKLYKNHSFDSEILSVVLPDEKLFITDLKNLHFEDAKEGFWISARKETEQSGWLWIE